jgi:hypothetical protein
VAITSLIGPQSHTYALKDAKLTEPGSAVHDHGPVAALTGRFPNLGLRHSPQVG